jgi:hypothetical protein
MTTTQKYTGYMPLISLVNGQPFVLCGWYTEADGIITLASGEKCKRWKKFPHMERGAA